MYVQGVGRKAKAKLKAELVLAQCLYVQANFCRDMLLLSKHPALQCELHRLRATMHHAARGAQSHSCSVSTVM
jgi:hypothetical protein